MMDKRINRARLRFALKGFMRREDGNVAIEAVIILPILFWCYLSMFAIFDAFRQYAMNQKAAYTIGDLISRQTTPMDPEFLNGTRALFDYLTRSNEESAIRVTSVRWDEANNVYKRDWSQALGWVSPVSNTQVGQWGTRLPIMPDNERVMVVETWSKYDPPFNTGLANREIRNFVFTRPRYAPRVLWQEPQAGI